MRSPPSSLVISRLSSLRIDLNSLWILKGDLSATLADPFELNTIGFLNVTSPRRETCSSNSRAHHGAQPREHVERISSAVLGLPLSCTPSRECGTSIGIDPSPVQRKATSRLGSVGQCCPPVSREGNGPRGPKRDIDE
ncbi:hypothetical protein PoB_004132700 [Plakobranchus ocellatus]|uniref:Uncharacterized protein n=1 Tax=Plakobranchus ocellatus TaxID=259542 RepID=A0AAV4B6S3_9GAST|nr:hypothetical protein PoB_004132700 [Plakobranchus ocellatus]